MMNNYRGNPDKPLRRAFMPACSDSQPHNRPLCSSSRQARRGGECRRPLKHSRDKMNGFICASLIPLALAQFYTQPVVYYQVPYASDQQYVYQTPTYQQVPYQTSLTQPSYGLQYLQPVYQSLQYPAYQNGLSQGLAGLYQNTLAKEVTGGYLNEFRDETGSLHRSGVPMHREPLTLVEHASYMSLINDKDNFQASGCGWDANLVKCTDALGLCKGGCRDFAVSASATVHDCRCIPYGYAALLKLIGKR
ncbi:hypothetical protein Y032_0097g3044 [Ancylostoma ceylanicum]|uniref:Uncharacterized protein n=1 Tax=Ancylostoma ceylanicum TaxID=53326 RepID=A0A016TJ07_9BILA|nr:hypothetical protein Y032_0097g3044 [Ancylostoma ceylanicum]